MKDILDLHTHTIASGHAYNTLYEINNRLNSLESRVKVLEQKLTNNNSYQDDGSMYML
jgi:hypothetical protein